jgi:hypothetical protein
VFERPTEETLKKQLDVWFKSWQTVDAEVPELRAALELRFRELLGVAVGI